MSTMAERKEQARRESEERLANWRDIFHRFSDFENAPQPVFAIKGFLQEGGVTVIGGLAGHSKTFIQLCMAKALMEGSLLFGCELFSVPTPAQRILYLVPECGIGPFWARLKLLGLEQFVKDDRLLIRTLSSPEQVGLTDARMLKASEGAHIFLDSVVRFTTGCENDAEAARLFSDVLFRLLQVGAKSICGCHHSPKSFESADFPTLENVLRGSGDMGAMVSTCWAIRQVDSELNKVYVANVKGRDFQPCAPFIIQGRPFLDDCGRFEMVAEPGTAGEMKFHLKRTAESGRPARKDKADKLPEILKLRAQGMSDNAIAKQTNVARSTLREWLFDYDATQKPSSLDQ